MQHCACCAGKATRLTGQFVPNGDFKSTKKVTWLAKVPDLVPMILVEFDYLVTKDTIEEGENFKDFLNPTVRNKTDEGLVLKIFFLVPHNT